MANDGLTIIVCNSPVVAEKIKAMNAGSVGVTIKELQQEESKKENKKDK